MEVMLHSTTKVVELVVGGATVPARIWEGVTASGVRCHAYITRIACATGQEAEFEAELMAQKPPTTEIEAIPLRLIL